MRYYVFWIMPLALAGFVGFWCLVVKLLSLMGWQRLATHFAVPELPLGPRFSVAQATVGGIRYRGVLQATVSAAGLGLRAGFPFRVGHAPLLIPWAAIGPVQAEKFLWTTSYSTAVRTPDGGSVSLRFTGEQLLEAARPWVRMQQT
ncbi:hypothetical protein F0P96_01455 [Hymenobacter busanensis]|uniref:Uncharacterized protein n=1 Tax=Hymenobacter busanensis TaxID=2607656 RepID=A0A7L4ZUR1_9BACT|nr:hypothetical protein [Hymenobacter busanensis]KAA9339320.1 hypothetical protein F0P96_01455 [Hymenobacter busanensis]QHJ06918.1 hypothetical protein GUY19_06295 [Hymenobacter busanensis]